MRLLPVFFVVSDLGGGASWGQSSCRERWGVGRFSQFPIFPHSFPSHFCCLTCRWFPKKRYFVVGAQIRLLSPSLHSVDISTDLLQRHLQNTRTGKFSHSGSVDSLPGVNVMLRLTGSRCVSSHRLPLLSLEEATLM